MNQYITLVINFSRVGYLRSAAGSYNDIEIPVDMAAYELRFCNDMQAYNRRSCECLQGGENCNRSEARENK